MLNAVSRVVLCSLLLSLVSRAPAQTTRRTSSRPANVQSGTVVALDAGDATLKLKTRVGSEISYRLTDKTRAYRDKKPVEPSAFTAGDLVYVRFRKSNVDPANVY